MLAGLQSTLTTAQGTLAAMSLVVNAHVATMGVSFATISPVPVTATLAASATRPVVVSMPAVFPGAGAPATRAVIAQAAKSCGLLPQVLEAIQRWETGNYSDPNAHAWILAWNPGGMKFNARNVIQLGSSPTPYQASSTAIAWQAWADWRTGILGHGLFLTHSNYDAARKETTIEGQLKAIWLAGYSEMDQDWLTNVTRIAKSLPPDYTPSSQVVVPSSDELERARSAIGKGIIYRQSIDGAVKGDDPHLECPGYYHADGSVTCDCSEFGAWVKRYRRANKWNTAGIKSDATGLQVCFSIVKKGSSVVGDQLNYYDVARSTGHHGYVSAVENGVPGRVIHCHSGQEPAIQETLPTIFWDNNADIVRYHGPIVA